MRVEKRERGGRVEKREKRRASREKRKEEGE